MPGLGEPLALPYMSIPEAPVISAPTLSLPKADIPSYKPLVVPPSNLQPPPGIKVQIQKVSNRQNSQLQIGRAHV